jgi:hypothetical protein
VPAVRQVREFQPRLGVGERSQRVRVAGTGTVQVDRTERVLDDVGDDAEPASSASTAAMVPSRSPANSTAVQSGT